MDMNAANYSIYQMKEKKKHEVHTHSHCMNIFY